MVSSDRLRGPPDKPRVFGSPTDATERIDLKAITVLPHTPGSASVDDIPEPDLRDGSVLVETIAVGGSGVQTGR